MAGIPLILRIHPRARRLRLRFDDRRRALTLTLPPRTSRRAALAWAAEQQHWVEAQLARRAPPLPLEPGAILSIDGEQVELAWIADAPRAVVRQPGLLSCGGPRDAFARRIEAWLKRLARERLSAETAEVALRAGVTVRAVSVGDADSRWGSCSASGAIRYSWRLILVPPAARRYVVAHEVAHRTHMDHGPRFKALEARLFGGDVAAARSLLRGAGPTVRRIGRDG